MILPFLPKYVTLFGGKEVMNMNHPVKETESAAAEQPRPGEMPDAPWASEIVVGTCKACCQPNNNHDRYCVHVNDSAD